MKLSLVEIKGLKTACLYSFKPYELGYCGPAGKLGLLQQIKDFIAGKDVEPKNVLKTLDQFVAAPKYYYKIAKANQLKRPYAEKVVRAYWIGNNLLNHRNGHRWHHNYHVMFIGSVSGRLEFTPKVVDLCRISWGRVTNQSRGSLLVLTQPLDVKKINGKITYYLRQPMERRFLWRKSILPQVSKGDLVTMHWGQVIEVVDHDQVMELKKYTQKSIEEFNDKAV